MFNTPHNPLRRQPQTGSEQRREPQTSSERRREPQTGSEQRREPRIGPERRRQQRPPHRRDTTTTRAVAPRQPFVDPVHGRHCICARCVQQRTA